MRAGGTRVDGAVLTGGASTRMGSDKALLPIDGVPMALRVAAALAAGGATTVQCIGGDRVRLEALGLTVVNDAQPGGGPLGGLLTALAAADGAGAALLVVAACDHPDLDGPTVAALVAALAVDPDLDHARPVDADGRAPLVVALQVATCSRALAEAWETGARSVEAGLATTRGRLVTGLDARALADVDHPWERRGR